MSNRFKQTVGPFSREELLTMFKSKEGSRICSEMMKNDPNSYHQAQSQARSLGLIGEGLRRFDTTLPVDPNGPHEYSAAELAARLKYSEEEIRALYKGTGDSVTRSRNLATISRDTPEELPMLREAAVSYGYLSKQDPRPTAPKPTAPVEPALFVLDDAMADKSNLPRGAKVSMETFTQISKNLQEKELATRRAAIDKEISDMHNKDGQ